MGAEGRQALRSEKGRWPAVMRAQGQHDREAFGACPVEMLEANVDSLDRTPGAYRGAHEDCSEECAAQGRCLRRASR